MILHVSLLKQADAVLQGLVRLYVVKALFLNRTTKVQSISSGGVQSDTYKKSLSLFQEQGYPKGYKLAHLTRQSHWVGG